MTAIQTEDTKRETHDFWSYFIRLLPDRTDPTMQGLRELPARQFQLELCGLVHDQLEGPLVLQGLEFLVLGDEAE